MKHKTILGIGNAVTDMVIPLPDNRILERFQLPSGGMTHIDKVSADAMATFLEGMRMECIPGGSAANTVAAASLLGMRCGFIGKVGNDPIGDDYLENLENNGICPHLSRGNLPSARSMAFVSQENGERTFATYLGAALEQNVEEIVPEYFDGYDYLHVEGYLLQCSGVVEKAMEIARDKGMTISLDLGSCSMVEKHFSLLHRLVNEYVDILFANGTEALSFTGKEGAAAALDISGMENSRTAVVKLGEKGSVVCRGGELYRIGAEPVNVEDTIGAGDAYAAGFLYAHSLGATLYDCGRAGAIIAAQAVGTVGPKIGNSRREEVKKAFWDYVKIKD